MSGKNELSGELAAIEAALRSLAPVPSGVDRDRLMYLAGRASGRPGARRAVSWLQTCVTAASLLGAVVFGGLWAGGQRADGGRLAQAPSATSPGTLDGATVLVTTPLSPWSNRRLCQLVLEKGVDAMPSSAGPLGSGSCEAGPPETYRSLLNDYLKHSI
jgi:hypothetical protein